MKTIPLTQGMVALVDDDDFERVGQYKWCIIKGQKTFYAVRNFSSGSGGFIRVYMHRFILGLTDSKIHVDHRDRNGLNNQKENIRACTRSQNMQYRRGTQDSSSRYKGVRFQYEKWSAHIRVNGKSIPLGTFYSESEAARAYNIAAKLHCGEFAYLNEIVEDPDQLTLKINP